MKLEEGESIWTKVEINDKELKEYLMANTEEVLNRITQEIHAADLDVVLGKPKVKKTTTVLAALREVLAVDSERVLILYCLRQFMLRKRKAICEVTIATFGEEQTKKHSSEFAMLCLLHDTNPVKIMDIYLRYQADNRSFDTYELHSERSSRPKADFEVMTEEKVNRLLDRMDEEKPGGKSFCWHVANVADATEMYIRTEADKPTLLSMLKDNVPAVLAESTILRFHKYGRTVEVWTKNDTSAKAILSHMARAQFDKEAFYTPQSYVNPIGKVNDFLYDITSRMDSKIKLLSFERVNAPLAGAPRILLESIPSIIPAVQELHSLGKDIILDSAIHVNSIAVEYEGYKIHLSLRISDDGILFIPPRTKGSNKLLVKMNDYMFSKHGLRISTGV